MSTFSSTTNTGIVLGSGTYTNPLTITSTGTVRNTTGAHSGDAVYGPSGTAWTVSNYGTIDGAFDGSQPAASGIDFVAGGAIANGTAGSIIGISNGILIGGAAGTVFNSGTIGGTGATGHGVSITAGGELN